VVLILDALTAARLPAGESTTQSEPAVRAAVAKYVEAWNARDMKTLVACWCQDGEFIDQAGNVFAPKELVDRQSGADPQAETNKLAVHVDSVRLLSPDVALVDGSTELVDAATQQPDKTPFSAVYLQRNGTWLLARVRELNASAQAPPNQLQELAWLIGNWDGAGDGTTMHATATWSENQKFIVRKLEIAAPGDTVHHGTQIIAWDPRTSTIRSWFFDSQGALGEGEWEKRGEHWIVVTSGVLSDGRGVSATNIYTPVDNDSYLQHSVRTQVGGQDLPDQLVRVVRRKETQ
jgi:uncharacterized protein (TIGR02246 family)